MESAITLSTFNIETLERRGSVKVDVHTVGEAYLVAIPIIGNESRVFISLEENGNLTATTRDEQGKYHEHILGRVKLEPQGTWPPINSNE